VGWVARGDSSRTTLLAQGGQREWGAQDVVPAQDVMVLPEGSVQGGLHEVVGTVMGVRVTGELRPVGPARGRITELAPGSQEAPKISGELNAVGPESTASVAESAAAMAPRAPRSDARGAVQAAVAAAGNAAAQADEAAGPSSAVVSKASPSDSTDVRATSIMPSTIGLNGGLFWEAAQAAATDKYNIKEIQATAARLGSTEARLGSKESKIGAQVSNLGKQEAKLGDTVSKDSREQTALTSVVKNNRLAINDLTEKLRRQKLIEEGQYGILYRRLTAVAER